MNVLEKVAKALTDKHGITVRFMGDRARTDGTQIILPALPENGEISEQAQENLKGLCDHEIGHCKFSFDKTIFEKISKHENPNIIKSLTNLVEDIRIEKLMSTAYIGAGQNMNKVAETYFGNSKQLEENILNQLCYEGRRQVCGYTLTKKSYVENLKLIFGDTIFDELAATKNEQDSYELACKIYGKKEKEEKEKKEEEKKIGENKAGSGKGSKGEKGKKGEKADSVDGDEGEQGDSVDEAEGKDEDEADESGKTDKEEQDEKEKNKGDDKAGVTAEKKGDSAGGEDSDAGDSGKSASGKESKGGGKKDKADEKKYGLDDLTKDAETVKDIYKEIKKKLEEEVKINVNAGKYLIHDKAKDKIIVVPQAENSSTYDGLKSSLGSMNVTRAKMANMFLTKTASRWINEREAGKINAKSLCRIATGYKNVFREKYVSSDVDTAISFLVDFSGSMMGRVDVGKKRVTAVECAMRAVVLFLESLQGAKIKSEVLGYTTGDLTGAIDHYIFGRCEALLTYVFKAFSEPFTQTIKRRIANFRVLGTCENCDPDSVLVAYERLMKRKEKRKILFVLTDGVVANRGNQEIGRKYLKELIPKLEKNCEVIGIGIGRGIANIDTYYKKNIKCDTTKLAESILGELKSILKIN